MLSRARALAAPDSCLRNDENGTALCFRRWANDAQTAPYVRLRPSQCHWLSLLSSLLTLPNKSKRPPFNLGPSTAAANVDRVSSGAFRLSSLLLKPLSSAALRK